MVGSLLFLAGLIIPVLAVGQECEEVDEVEVCQWCRESGRHAPREGHDKIAPAKTAIVRPPEVCGYRVTNSTHM